jgi:hypothetical protein
MNTFGRTDQNHATPAKFEDFMMGFNQATERFTMIDVGNSKEAADSKIKGVYYDATLMFEAYVADASIS